MEEKNFVITEKNVQEYAMKMGKWIKDYIENTKSKGVVLGMSGAQPACKHREWRMMP